MFGILLTNDRFFLFQILNEKEKIQAEIAEQSPYLFNTIRVKPINTINETVEDTI